MKLDLAVMTGKGIKIFKFGKYAKLTRLQVRGNMDFQIQKLWEN